MCCINYSSVSDKFSFLPDQIVPIENEYCRQYAVYYNELYRDQ